MFKQAERVSLSLSRSDRPACRFKRIAHIDWDKQDNFIWSKTWFWWLLASPCLQRKQTGASQATVAETNSPLRSSLSCGAAQCKCLCHAPLHHSPSPQVLDELFRRTCLAGCPPFVSTFCRCAQKHKERKCGGGPHCKSSDALCWHQPGQWRAIEKGWPVCTYPTAFKFSELPFLFHVAPWRFLYTFFFVSIPSTHSSFATAPSFHSFVILTMVYMHCFC